MVKSMNKRMDWAGGLTVFLGAAVVIPSLIALAVAIGAVVLELL